MNSLFRKAPHLAAHHITRFAADKPRLYYSLLKLTGRHSSLCVDDNTDLVIEGFPRSANTFTYRFILQNQLGKLRIAHHRHHVAQLLEGIKLGKPTIMLIRPPRDAIISVRSLSLEHVGRGGRPNRGYFESLLDFATLWERFYDKIVPHLDAVVTSSFRASILEPERAVWAAGERFGVKFIPDSGLKQPDTTGLWHSKPTDTRSSIKQSVSQEFDDELNRNVAFARKVRLCQEIHDYILSHPNTLK